MINNKKLNIFIIIYLIFFGSIITFLILNNKILCPFKNIFDIPCPFCGLTRAFRQILKLNFKVAMYYNILSVPLLIVIIVLIICIIKDIIRKENTVEKFIKDMDRRYCVIIVILLIISEVVNIYHGI